MRRGLVPLACALGFCSLPASAAFAQFPTGPTRDASELAGAIVGDPSSLSSASFVAIPPNGAPAWRGAGWGPQDPLDGFTLGAISTGDSRHPSQPGFSPSYSNNNGGAQTRGAYDVTILRLEFDVPQEANCLGFGVYYLSEDFGSDPNDFEGARDGFIAELDPATPWSLDGVETAAPDNFAFFDFGNNFVLNPLSADPTFDAFWGSPASNATATGTTYDGGTGWLHALKEISPGAHTLELSVFDRGDNLLDSTVLIDNVRLVRRVAGRCPTGGARGIADLEAPAVSLTSPANGASTEQGAVVLSGAAGTASGDEAAVRVRVYSGGQAAGSPVREQAAGAQGSSWQTTAQPPLAPGAYTAQASQQDGEGNEGLSAAHTFTVLAPPQNPGTPGGGGGSVSTTPQPAGCRVAKLKGKTLKAAKRALARARCRLGKVRRKRSAARPGRVIAQKPKAGTRRPRGARVNVVLSKRR